MFTPRSSFLLLCAAGLLGALTGCRPPSSAESDASPASPPAETTSREVKPQGTESSPADSAKGASAPSPEIPSSAEIPTPDFAGHVQPLLETYCYKCHGQGKKKGGLALDGFASQDASLRDQKTWGHVLENLRIGDMPPDDEKQPSLEERERIMTWIDRVVFAVDPTNPDPGRVTIHRLNRAEYNNTIRDLVGVEFQPADDFPADDSGYGFDNIGDVLSSPQSSSSVTWRPRRRS